LKTAQIALSLLGLASIVLAYKTGQVAYLIIALVAFIGGLYYMGAIGRRSSTPKQDPKSEKDAGNTKDKSRRNKP
jgi:hypothetical protein